MQEPSEFVVLLDRLVTEATKQGLELTLKVRHPKGQTLTVSPGKKTKKSKK